MRRIATVAGVASLLLLSGCPDSGPASPASDGGDVRLTDGGDLTGDTDGDGLCDETEGSRGTDPTDPDTDGDGFTDYHEVLFRYDPLRPSEPDRARVVGLSEARDATALVSITQTVNGSGEDYVGAFEAPSVRGSVDVSASSFFADSYALDANPGDNVAAVDAEGRAFRGVVGTTQLVYEVRFEFSDNIARECMHLYPFRYTIKRSDGRVVGRQRFLLLVAPVGQNIGSGEWCVPPEPCL